MSTPFDGHWLEMGACVPIDIETTAALVSEIHRLIDVIGGMALSQPEQEPAAWMMPENKRNGYNMRTIIENKEKPPIGEWKPLYATPPAREWVGLTQDQVDDLAEDGVFLGSVYEITRAIEAKLKELNYD